jgi:hypothetical protein
MDIIVSFFSSVFVRSLSALIKVRMASSILMSSARVVFFIVPPKWAEGREAYSNLGLSFSSPPSLQLGPFVTTS